MAIADEDTADVANVLLEWAGDPKVDRDGLTQNLDQLIGEFRGTVLSGIEFSHIFSRVFDLLRDYQLALPPDLAILLRTLLTAEGFRSEEHTSELQSLMRISYAVFCLKKKTKHNKPLTTTHNC